MSGRQPLVSVIIPVFNLEGCLAETVDSVLRQTFRDLEVILVDDGSTDRSRELIGEYAQREPARVRAVFQAHAGASAARNAGIRAAQGEWIAFLDGDDAWLPRKLEIQLQAASGDPRLNLLSTAAEIIGGNALLPAPNPGPIDVRTELLRKGCFITLSSVLLRRELLADEGFDETLPGAQDLALYLRLAANMRYRFIPEPLVRYRVRPGAISDPRGTRYVQLRSHRRIMRREMKRLKAGSPALYHRHKRELRAVTSHLAHEAAYHSLSSRTASLRERLAAACAAVRESPLRIKNYRFLMQALLPRSLNHRLRGRSD